MFIGHLFIRVGYVISIFFLKNHSAYIFLILSFAVLLCKLFEVHLKIFFLLIYLFIYLFNQYTFFSIYFY